MVRSLVCYMICSLILVTSEAYWGDPSDSEECNNEEVRRACKPDEATPECSGRGVCICGACDCNPGNGWIHGRRYSGRFCECDDRSCDYSRENYEMCGGSERGKCVCGECMCEEGYTGSACDCPLSTESCKAFDGQICNRKGSCKCGRCNCSVDTYYSGPTCEDCPACPGICDQLKPCVEGKVFGAGPYTYEDVLEHCSSYDIHMVSQLNVSGNVRQCEFMDEDDCSFSFTYKYDSFGTAIVKVRRTMFCSGPH